MLRLAEARRQGRVARSADLTSAAVILAAVVAFCVGGGVMLDELVKMLGGMLSFERTAPGATASLWSAAAPVAWITVCFGGVLVLAAAVAGVLQVGLHVSDEVVKPQADRLSPAAGFRRVFSSRGLVRATLAMVKIAAVGLVAWMTIGGQLPQIAADCALSVEAQWAGAWTMLAQMAWRVVLVLAVLGGIDWLYQWRRHRQDLMMTRRELLEDLRKSEGDPMARARRRSQRQFGAGEEA